MTLRVCVSQKAEGDDDGDREVSQSVSGSGCNDVAVEITEFVASSTTPSLDPLLARSFARVPYVIRGKKKNCYVMACDIFSPVAYQHV